MAIQHGSEPLENKRRDGLLWAGLQAAGVTCPPYVYLEKSHVQTHPNKLPASQSAALDEMCFLCGSVAQMS